MEKKEKLLILGNVIAVFSTIFVNALANILPIGGNYTGDIADNIPNLFVPAGITFSIWGVIYILITIFAIYQIKDWLGKFETKSDYLRKISFWFILGSIGNILWIILWHYEQILFSLFPILLLFFSLMMAYLRLDVGKSKAEKQVRYFVHLPISVYFGWLTVATIANITAVLVNLEVGSLFLGEVIWTILVIVVAMLITLILIYQRADVGYSLVIIWALFGIVIKQYESYQIIAYTAILSMIIIAGFLIYTINQQKRII